MISEQGMDLYTFSYGKVLLHKIMLKFIIYLLYLVDWCTIQTITKYFTRYIQSDVMYNTMW